MQFELWDSDDVPVPRKELLQKVKGVDGLVCVLTERIDAELLDAAGLTGQSLGQLNDKCNESSLTCAYLYSCRSKPEGPQYYVGGF